MDSSRPPPRTGRLAAQGGAPQQARISLPSPGSRAAWSDETPPPGDGFHDTVAPEATVPVGSVSPVAHWTSEETNSDGTPFVLRADLSPPLHVDATLSDVGTPSPHRVSQPTQHGLPDARSFLSTPEATVQMNPDAHGDPHSDAPATLPLGSITSLAHAPLVATRPSPFENPAMPSAMRSPLVAMTRPQGPLPAPTPAPQAPYMPAPAVSLNLSNALPPRTHDAWHAPSQPQPQTSQPSRATSVALLIGLVIVSVLVMLTLVVAVLASRR